VDAKYRGVLQAVPAALQTWPDWQFPQLIPQPSSPQIFPTQVQGVHEPPAQV
jgi:hypothetical protein